MQREGEGERCRVYLGTGVVSTSVGWWAHRSTAPLRTAGDCGSEWMAAFPAINLLLPHYPIHHTHTGSSTPPTALPLLFTCKCRHSRKIWDKCISGMAMWQRSAFCFTLEHRFIWRGWEMEQRSSFISSSQLATVYSTVSWGLCSYSVCQSGAGWLHKSHGWEMHQRSLQQCMKTQRGLSVFEQQQHYFQTFNIISPAEMDLICFSQQRKE